MKPLFDLREAQQMADSFTGSTGIYCHLYDTEGTLLNQRSGFCDQCPYGNASRDACERIHRHSAVNSERFGGRYIYLCPSSLSFFASPIMIGGVMAGSFVAGPSLIISPEDYLDENTEYLNYNLDSIPKKQPSDLSQLSLLLFACAVYVSDNVQEILRIRSSTLRQNAISDYIQQLKKSKISTPYPYRKEQALIEAVSNGNRSEAFRSLNELMGYILYAYPDPEQQNMRIRELLIIISRGTLYGGGNSREIMILNDRYLAQLKPDMKQEQLNQWLSTALEQYLRLVVPSSNSKHQNQIRSAINYMQQNLVHKLTMNEVAECIGYSPFYFSRIFKEETGSTFRSYLNSLRVERSKDLLLSGNLPISEICSLSGFEDESYFCKVFRSFTGTSPDRYRKQGRRIDHNMEYGLSQKKP